MNASKGLAPLSKFLMMLFFIGATYAVSDDLLIVGLILSQLAIALVTGQWRLYRATLLALAFAGLTLTLFQVFDIRQGRVVFAIIPSLGFGQMTDVGLLVSLKMVLRMISSVGSIPLMLGLTPSTQLMSLIAGSFRLPVAATCMLTTALRFIPTFGERMRLVLQAEASRGYHADTRNPLLKVGMAIRLSFPLLLTCVRDVDKLALSLEVRGFDPASKVRPQSISLRRPDYLTMAFFLLFCLCFVAAQYLLLA
jgi:energy-coupling factor transport system permease protein